MGDRAAAAQENFFKEAHLTALRELALRSPPSAWTASCAA